MSTYFPRKRSNQMKLERSKEWWIDRARKEGDAVVGAGLVARDPAPESRSLAAGLVERAPGQWWREE